MIPALINFADKVGGMRELQRRYFANRDQATLKAAKAAEAEVDAVCRSIAEEEHGQTNLFDEPEKPTDTKRIASHLSIVDQAMLIRHADETGLPMHQLMAEAISFYLSRSRLAESLHRDDESHHAPGWGR